MRPRVIAVLLIDERRAVKTRSFRNPRYLGDPINIVKIFNDKGVDELAVIDIGRGAANSPDYEMIEDIATEAFMPVSYGGGVFDIASAARVFNLGVEKVVFGRAASERPETLQETSSLYGSQAVSVSIDVRTLWGNYQFVRNTRGVLPQSPDLWARHVENLGAGEIFLTSVAREGRRSGYDLRLLDSVSRAVSVPVVANGGAGCLHDFSAAARFGASAVAAGSLFSFIGPHDAVLVNYPTQEQLDVTFKP